jgi:drug/metabolite transporter (DMT)-like permease
VLSGAILLFASMCARLFLREEKMSSARALAVALGFVGVLLIARPWPTAASGVNSACILYMVIGSCSVGCSFVYAHRFIRPLKWPAAALTTYQIGLAPIFLSILTGFNGAGALFDSPRA